MPLRNGATGLVLALALGLAPSVADADQLHSSAELDQFAFAAVAGLEPWKSRQEQLYAQASEPWAWGSAGELYVTTVASGGKKTCHPASDPDQVDYLKNGAADAYAKVLAFRATHRVDRDAILAFEARALVMALADTHGFHGPDGDDYSGDNQCVLDLAVSIPIWIASAELLEEAGLLSVRDRTVLSYWLEQEVYPLVAWASRVRRNNWGAAGSLAARMIARYAAPVRPVLTEFAPRSRVIFATDAVREHDRIQRDRIGNAWRGDARCDRLGIQPDGGIPEELRRGAGGCDASDFASANDTGLNYQTMHVELLVMHAEAMRREGDASLFEARTTDGDPALLQAILFVIDNPNGGRSWDWGVRTGALRVAARYYEDPRLMEQVAANASLGYRGGRTYPYTQIHPETGP